MEDGENENEKEGGLRGSSDLRRAGLYRKTVVTVRFHRELFANDERTNVIQTSNSLFSGAGRALCIARGRRKKK